MTKRKRRQHTNRACWIVFLLYLCGMLLLLLVRPQLWTEGVSYRQQLQQNTNLTPFYTIDNYLNIIFHYPNSNYFRHCLINLLGNTLLFIPAGWFIPRLLPKAQNFFLFLFISIISLLFIETLQLVSLLGCFDVDDIVLNLTGMILGYLIFIFRSRK